MVAASRTSRRFLALAAIALVYAFLAGLRTVSDFDIGWQLATGRWVAQHHHTFSTDVFSYTAYGKPWIYPVGSGLLFYAAFLIGGYGLISWMGAAACCGTVALLLRRGSAVTAALAILAVPLAAYRTVPRADMFTVVLFAAYLSILWQNYRTSRAPLWLLPVLMLAWVNLHLGFAAGLALMLAFLGVEILELPFSGTRRRDAVQRLKRELPWFAATAVATLANPWGWGIYQALIRQDRVMAQHSQWLTEWFSLPMNWTAIASTLSLRGTDGTVYLVLLIAVIAVVMALLQRQLGAAILLAGAAYQSVRYIRMEALMACVVVVVGGSILYSGMQQVGAWIPRPETSTIKTRSILAVAAVVFFAALALLRSADLVTNRHYLLDADIYTFGTGPGWWFPAGAAEFIERENIPGEIFNTYEEGGYVAWRLGPQHRDYIDGRAIPFGPEGYPQQLEMQLASLDSALWRQQADRYHINTILLPLARIQMLPLRRLKDFCKSHDWRPVYLDEMSAVFVRRTPETENLIQRSAVNCETAALPANPIGDSSAAAFHQWANAASVLAGLGRSYDALAATDKALRIFPGSSDMHALRGKVLYGMGRQSEAEPEFVAAITLDSSETTWSTLAEWYRREGKIPQAIHALQQATQLSYQPHLALLRLAQYYLEILDPKAALRTLDEAVRRAPAGALAANGKHSFKFDVAQARADAWRILGETQRATESAEEAVQVDPESADAWSALAKLYEQQGRSAEQRRAEERATALAGAKAGNAASN